VKDYLAGVRSAEPSEVKLAWLDFLRNLRAAERLHDGLGTYSHPRSWHFYGHGKKTASYITLKRRKPLPSSAIPGPVVSDRGMFRMREFSGFTEVVTTMSPPDGSGDGTVAASSGAALVDANKQNGFPVQGVSHDSFFLESLPSCLKIRDLIQDICLKAIKATGQL
jgi:hypothetical protein